MVVDLDTIYSILEYENKMLPHIQVDVNIEEGLLMRYALEYYIENAKLTSVVSKQSELLCNRISKELKKFSIPM
jgi:hypothetical protein